MPQKSEQTTTQLVVPDFDLLEKGGERGRVRTGRKINKK
jgi:hypothetical protein